MILDGLLVSHRPAEVSDAAEVVRIFQAARAAGLAFVPVLHDHEEDLAFFGSHIAAGRMTLATVGDKPVAFSVFADGRLQHLFVDPVWWGQRIGRMLLRIEMSRRPEGFDLYVFDRNERARDLYRRAGFAEVEFGETNEERLPDVRMAWPGGEVEPPSAFEITPGGRIRLATRAVIRDRNDRVLLAEWNRSEFERAKWVLPGGGLHVGEGLTSGLARELREETGLVIERAPTLRWVWTTKVMDPHNWIGQRNHIYEVVVDTFDANPGMTAEQLAQEHMGALRWFTPDEIAANDMLHPGPLGGMLVELLSGTIDGVRILDFRDADSS